MRDEDVRRTMAAFARGDAWGGLSLEEVEAVMKSAQNESRRRRRWSPESMERRMRRYRLKKKLDEDLVVLLNRPFTHNTILSKIGAGIYTERHRVISVKRAVASGAGLIVMFNCGARVTWGEGALIKALREGLRQDVPEGRRPPNGCKGCHFAHVGER